MARIQQTTSTPFRSNTLIGAPAAADIGAGLRLMTLA